MISPQHISEVLDQMPWPLRHELLRAWFQTELEAAADNPELRQREWWVQEAYARCPHCRIRKWRIEIGGHWRSPFYFCRACGVVESYRDLTR